MKTPSWKSRQIEIFPKRLTQGFGRKMTIFPTFFFRQYGLGKCVLPYSSRHFFKGVKPWFCYKKAHFSNFFLLGNIGQENVFYNILGRNKNTQLKKSKN